VQEVPQLNPSGYIPPPRFPWPLLLILHVVTFGLFGIIWMIRQSRWAKQVDPSSNATPLLVVALILSIAAGRLSVNPDLLSIAGLTELGGIICFQLGNFHIKGAMETYYNSVEQRNLSLSAPITFFFAMVYFQYQFDRLSK
jgi:hypothetical protein